MKLHQSSDKALIVWLYSYYLVILVGPGLGIQHAQSRACSIILIVYTVFSMPVSLIINGSPSGTLVLFSGIYAAIFTFRFQKAWAEYQRSGIVPELK